jgi:hypothetical protein
MKNILSLNESEKDRILNLHKNPDLKFKLFENREIEIPNVEEFSNLYTLNNTTLLEKLSTCKFSSDLKYVMFEDNVYNIIDGKRVILSEDWSFSDIAHTATDLISAGADFIVPGSGAVIDVVHGLSYIIEAQFKSEEEKDSYYLMAAITFAFAVLPGPLQAVAPALKSFIKGTTKVITKPVAMALRVVGRILEEVLAKIPAYIGKAVDSPLGKRLLGKYAPKVSSFFANFSARIRKIFSKLIPDAAAGTKAVAKTTGKAGKQQLAKSKKDAFYSFIRMAKPIANPTKVLKKLGFVTGKTYRYVGKNGKATTAKIIGISENGVQVAFAKGQKMMVPAETFVKNAVGAPWGRKGYTVLVPLFIKRFADMLTSNGDIDQSVLDKFEDLDPNVTSAESLDFLQEEVASYEGGTGQYTVNNNVSTIQNGLISLGYKLPRFGADGKFGNETKKTLEKFQNENGLSSSLGKMDRATAKKMAELLKSKNVEGTEDLQQSLMAI